MLLEAEETEMSGTTSITLKSSIKPMLRGVFRLVVNGGEEASSFNSHNGCRFEPRTRRKKKEGKIRAPDVCLYVYVWGGYYSSGSFFIKTKNKKTI